MAGYLKGALTPPLVVDADGKVLKADATPGFSAAVIPFLEALGMKDEAKVQSDRLGATKDTGSGLYGHGADYYDQNLAMFSTAWSEERYRFERDGRLRVKWK
jgi:endoglucanase